MVGQAAWAAEQETGVPRTAHDELELGQKRVREEEERLAREAEQPKDRA